MGTPELVQTTPITMVIMVYDSWFKITLNHQSFTAFPGQIIIKINTGLMNPDWFFCFLPGWLLPTKFKMAFACICPKVQGGVAQWLWQFNGTELNGKLIGLNGDRLNMGLNGKLIGLWSEIMVISWNGIWRDLMVFNIQVREILPFIQIWLVVWNMFYFSIQSRIIILTDELIFFRGVGSNHQPVTIHPDKISPDSHESLITINHH